MTDTVAKTGVGSAPGPVSAPATPQTISQREMRNNSGEILRRVAAGESFVVTNNGEPVADLIPHAAPRPKPKPDRPRRAAKGTAHLLPRYKPASGRSSAEILEEIRREWWEDR